MPMARMRLRMNAWLIIAAINGFLAVAFGAFGAHGLRANRRARAARLRDRRALSDVSRARDRIGGNRSTRARRHRREAAAAIFFLAGIVLFSGSLYRSRADGHARARHRDAVRRLSFLVGWGGSRLGGPGLRRTAKPFSLSVQASRALARRSRSATAERQVTVLDRDPPPPDASPEEAFYTWERRGATQLRHSHVFLGRLTTLIRERYPDLMEELLDAGARVFQLRGRVAAGLASTATPPMPGDDEMSFSSAGGRHWN